MRPDPDPSPSSSSPPRSLGEVASRTLAALGRERSLTALGVMGLLLSAVCLVGVGVHGPVNPPEGKMLDAVTFNLGVGIFLLTVALILPLADFPKKGRRRLRRLFLAFAGYGLTLETVQAFRGMDPRFSPLHGTVDQIAGGLFGLNALLLTVAFAILGLRFFDRDVLRHRPVLRLGIRYGSVPVAISFGVGIGMSAIQGRIVGEAGNLLPAHGLGVHGIQVLPLAALLILWGGMERPGRWLHAAGAGWLLAVGAVLAQALLGRPPLEPSLAGGLALAGLLTAAAVLGRGLLAWSSRIRPVVAGEAAGQSTAKQ